MSVKYPEVIVPMVGEDGNAFAIIGRVAKALTRAGERDGARDFRTAALGCGSYDEILVLVMRTVEVA